MLTDKWLNRWLNMCDQVAAWSNCPRAQVGAFIVKDNQPISQGFNGPPKGAAKLCGGGECRRDTLAIKSGTSTEVGCHHAEANAITQAAKNGIALAGATLIVNCEPCLSCAKLIHHSGLELVVIGGRGYSKDGIEYLKRAGVKIKLVI